jgi:hypothetical protein
MTGHEVIPLCYRCEKRARWLESKQGYRCGCKRSEGAVWSCYAYEPVRPLVQQLNTGERCSPFLPEISCGRSHAVAVADDDVVERRLVVRKDKTWVSTWEVTPEEKRKGRG